MRDTGKISIRAPKAALRGTWARASCPRSTQKMLPLKCHTAQLTAWLYSSQDSETVTTNHSRPQVSRRQPLPHLSKAVPNSQNSYVLSPGNAQGL